MIVVSCGSMSNQQKTFDDYLDFCLTIKGKITSNDEEKYNADLAVSSTFVGESTKQKGPFTADLKCTLENFSKYECAQHETPASYLEITEENIKYLGDQLFEELFVDQISKDFSAAFDETKSQGIGLRILLYIEPSLTWFPWEIIRFDSRFLGTETRTPLLRIFPGTKLQGVNLEERKMPRVLSVLSDVEAETAVDKSFELTSLETSILKENRVNFSGLEQVGPEPGTKSSNPTLVSFQEALNKPQNNPGLAPYNIIHFLAHGLFDDENDQSAIVLQPTVDQKLVEKKDKIEVSGATLRERLGDKNNIGLVVLNACSTGRILSNSSGLVPELLQVAPAVVGMRKKIGKDMAKEFTAQFYKGFSPLNAETAIQGARKGMYAMNQKTLDFSVPVFYLGCDKSLVPCKTIFKKTLPSVKAWTPATHLNPAGMSIMSLLQLHDNARERQKFWNKWFEDDKDLIASQMMPLDLLRKTLVETLDDSLTSTCTVICSTFASAVDIWKEAHGRLSIDMDKLVDIAHQGKKQEIRPTVNEIQQNLDHIERLICHIITTGRGEAIP